MSKRRKKPHHQQKNKNKNQSAYKNQNAKRPRKIRLSVVDITTILYGSNYIDWEIYTNDEICSDIGRQEDGRVAGKTIRDDVRQGEV